MLEIGDTDKPISFSFKANSSGANSIQSVPAVLRTRVCGEIKRPDSCLSVNIFGSPITSASLQKLRSIDECFEWRVVAGTLSSCFFFRFIMDTLA